LNRFEKRLKDGKWQAIKEKDFPIREDSEKRAEAQGAGRSTIARAVLVQSINKRMVQGEGQKAWDEVLDVSPGISASAKLDKTAGRNIQIENTPLYQILYQSATKKV